MSIDINQNLPESPNDPSSPTPPTEGVERAENVGVTEVVERKEEAAFGAAPLLGVHRIQLPEGAKLTPLRISDKKEQQQIIDSWKANHPNETTLPQFVFDTPDIPDDLRDLVEFRSRQETTL